MFWVLTRHERNGVHIWQDSDFRLLALFWGVPAPPEPRPVGVAKMSVGIAFYSSNINNR